MFENVLWCIGHDLLIPDIIKAKGCYLYDSKGSMYLDMESGTWCVVAGHCNSFINRSIKKQLDTIAHTGYCYSHQIVSDAASSVLEISGLKNGKCVFLSSGSEAVEFGVQLLRHITRKPKLMTFDNSFLSSYGSSGEKKKDEWHLFNWDKCVECTCECTQDCPKLKAIPIEQIGGFVFEPGSTSGVIKFPPDKLITNIIKLIKESRGLVQVNEITTGIGSTGKWFGFQYYGFQADVVSMGKRLGNGYPVSAVSMSAQTVRLAESENFKYSQSHQNDPLGCAAAKAVITFIKQRNLIEHSMKMGNYLEDKLMWLKSRHAIIKDVRGRGLMCAVEFAKSVSSDDAGKIYRRLLNEKIIIAKRPGLNVFRIDPPLIVTQNQIDLLISALDAALLSDL